MSEEDTPPFPPPEDVEAEEEEEIETEEVLPEIASQPSGTIENLEEAVIENPPDPEGPKPPEEPPADDVPADDKTAPEVEETPEEPPPGTEDNTSVDISPEAYFDLPVVEPEEHPPPDPDEPEVTDPPATEPEEPEDTDPEEPPATEPEEPEEPPPTDLEFPPPEEPEKPEEPESTETNDEFARLDDSPPPEDVDVEDMGNSESRLLKSFDVVSTSSSFQAESAEDTQAGESESMAQFEDSEVPAADTVTIPDGDDLDESSPEGDETETTLPDVPPPPPQPLTALDCAGFVEIKRKPVLELTGPTLTEVENPDYCVERRLKPVLNIARKALAAYDSVLACDTFGCNACDPPIPCEPDEPEPGLFAWLQNLIVNLLWSEDNNQNAIFPEDGLAPQEEDPCSEM